ncbi:MAG: threonine--tRNA ligase, partial [Deltaproteobacteria bacterium]
FLGILIEHFAGKFPLWMAPIQLGLLAINDELVPYANEIRQVFESAGLRTEVDGRAESLNKKIRDAQLQQIPLILTVGGKEKQTGTVSVRTLDGKVKYGITQQDFLNAVLSHVSQRKLALDIFES